MRTCAPMPAVSARQESKGQRTYERHFKGLQGPALSPESRPPRILLKPATIERRTLFNDPSLVHRLLLPLLGLHGYRLLMAPFCAFQVTPAHETLPRNTQYTLPAPLPLALASLTLPWQAKLYDSALSLTHPSRGALKQQTYKFYVGHGFDFHGSKTTTKLFFVFAFPFSSYATFRFFVLFF